MKNILIFGDSITMGASINSVESPGYGPIVKEKLTGKYNVFFIPYNTNFAVHSLRYFIEYAKSIGVEDLSSIDLIHWNNGLWDVQRMFDEDPLTPIDAYVYYICRIYDRMKVMFPNAKIVFATMTAANMSKASPNRFRADSDIIKYNQAVVKALTERGAIIDDLYSVSSKFDGDIYLDNVHFKTEGCNMLADAVIKIITDNI